MQGFMSQHLAMTVVKWLLARAVNLDMGRSFDLSRTQRRVACFCCPRSDPSYGRSGVFELLHAQFSGFVLVSRC